MCDNSRGYLANCTSNFCQICCDLGFWSLCCIYLDAFNTSLLFPFHHFHVLYPVVLVLLVITCITYNQELGQNSLVLIA